MKEPLSYYVNDPVVLRALLADPQRARKRLALHRREDHYIAQADAAMLRAEEAETPEERERQLRIERWWARKLDVVQARLDAANKRDYTPSACVAEERTRPPRRGPRRRGAGRPGARRRARARSSSSDDDGPADPEPVARRHRRAARRGARR